MKTNTYCTWNVGLFFRTGFWGFFSCYAVAQKRCNMLDQELRGHQTWEHSLGLRHRGGDGQATQGLCHSEPHLCSDYGKHHGECWVNSYRSSSRDLAHSLVEWTPHQQDAPPGTREYGLTGNMDSVPKNVDATCVPAGSLPGVHTQTFPCISHCQLAVSWASQKYLKGSTSQTQFYIFSFSPVPLPTHQVFIMNVYECNLLNYNNQTLRKHFQHFP